MSSCEQIQELISRMLDEALEPQELALVEQHRKCCPECEATYAAFHALSATLSTDLEEAPAALRENVMAELRRDEVRKKNRRQPWPGVLAAAACAVLLLGVSRLLTPALAMPQSLLAADYAAVTATSEEAAAEEPVLFSRAALLPAEEAAAGAVSSADAASNAGRFLSDTADRGTVAYELPALSTEELLRFLGGDAVEGLAASFDGETPVCTVVTADSMVTFYFVDGTLIYSVPEAGVFSTARSLDAVLAFVQS